MLSRKEKEELIVRLLEEEKTTKEIMKEAHASPNLISSIRKKLEGEESHPSIQNQAYRMFYEERKKPIEVAILLHIDNVEATRYWKEYLQLKREYTLLKIRNEFEGNFSQFINLYWEMKKKNYGLDELKRALEIVRKTDTAIIFLMKVEDDKKKREEELGQLEEKITILNNDILVAKQELNWLQLPNRLLSLDVK